MEGEKHCIHSLYNYLECLDFLFLNIKSLKHNQMNFNDLYFNGEVP